MKKIEQIHRLFNELSVSKKRQCLQELSDNYDVVVNYDLITDLKQRLRDTEIELGKVKSYITELEDNKPKMTFEEMYCSIPKVEREKLKKQIATAWLYQNLLKMYKKFWGEVKQLRKDKETLVYQLIQEKNKK